MTGRFGKIAQGLALLLAPGCFAGPILVTNASFETLPVAGLPFNCGAGCTFSNDDIPGWVSAPKLNPSGQFQPGAPGNTSIFNSIPDGITIAYSNGNTISQIVAPLVQLGVTYTLTVDVGVRKDLNALGQVQLIIGGGAPIIATGVLPTPGNWAPFTATYIGLAGDVGKTIQIALTSSGTQSDWDNVRLSDDLPSGVPEPATLPLLGAAFASFAAWKRFRA